MEWKAYLLSKVRRKYLQVLPHSYKQNTAFYKASNRMFFARPFHLIFTTNLVFIARNIKSSLAKLRGMQKFVTDNSSDLALKQY